MGSIDESMPVEPPEKTGEPDDMGKLEKPGGLVGLAVEDEYVMVGLVGMLPWSLVD